MKMNELEEIFKDSNAISFLIYKGLEGAANAVEEIRIGKSVGIYDKDFSKNFFEGLIQSLVKNYTEGSIKRKIMFKALMALPWSDTARFIYDILLDFGKREDGSYRKTGDTLFGSLKKYFGE